MQYSHHVSEAVFSRMLGDRLASSYFQTSFSFASPCPLLNVLFLSRRNSKEREAERLTKKCWPLKCSQRQLFDRHSNHQWFLLFSLRLVVDTFFRQWALSGWLEYLKSQLDPVMKAVPVRADWSLIYTVPIGSWDCVRSSFSFSVWAAP